MNPHPWVRKTWERLQNMGSNEAAWSELEDAGRELLKEAGVDSREVFDEAYYKAKDEGRSDEEAAAIADEARIDHESALVDEAMNRAKED